MHIHMKHGKSKFSSLFEKSPLDLDKKCVKIKPFFFNFRMSYVLNFNSNTFRRQETRLLCSRVACVTETRAVASVLYHDSDFFSQNPIFLLWALSEKLRCVINIHVVACLTQPKKFIRFDDSTVL